MLRATSAVGLALIYLAAWAVGLPAAETEKSEAAAKEETKAPDAEKPAPDAPPAPVADGETPPQQKARAKPPAEAAAPSPDYGVVFNSGPDPAAEVMEDGR